MIRQSTCNRVGCGQPIIFGFNPKTRNRIPLNPRPDPAGNQACRVDVHGSLLARVPTDEDRIEPFERLYMPHFATCKGQQPPKPGSPVRLPTAAPSSVPDAAGQAGGVVVPLDRARRRRR